MSQESKDRIREQNIRTWENRRSWVETSNNIIRAFESGDTRTALSLYHGYFSDYVAARVENSGAIITRPNRERKDDQELTDEEIAEIREALRTEIGRLSALYKRLDPPRAGIYGRRAAMPSPAERNRLRKIADAEHEAGR